MEKKEFEIYEEIKDWDFSSFGIRTEKLTNWNLYDLISDSAKEGYKILDLGTGGGEKALGRMPINCEIVGTDYSPAMIETANKNLAAAGRTNVTFKVMDNLKMNVSDEEFNIITARNTITDKNQIYKALRNGGLLFLRGVDKSDCWDLKRKFKTGQGYLDSEHMSLLDYNEVIDAGFKNVELIPLYTREYFKDPQSLEKFLRKVPILTNFENENPLDTEAGKETLNAYVTENTSQKGILLKRVYYGISARK